MRLGTCVAFELAFGIALAGSIGGAAHWGLGELKRWEQREAQAASMAPATRRAVTAGPRIEPVAIPGEVSDPHAPAELFEGVRDELLLAPLRDGALATVDFNRGGSSISLRIDFDNGARAAFKPQQINLQTVPRREVAAYRLDRLLGLGAVPPTIGRSFDFEELLSAVEPDSEVFLPRLREEIIVDGSRVAGQLSWWIPVIRPARIAGYLVDETDGIVTWKRELTVGKPITDGHWRMLAQISNMLVFDFLINNSDRWSGRNVMSSPDGQMLYFMDNALSFGNSRSGHARVRIYLERCQKFSRSLVERLRRLQAEQVRAAVSDDLGAFDFLLDEREIEAVMARRDRILEYIDALIAEHGDDAVLVFP